MGTSVDNLKRNHGGARPGAGRKKGDISEANRLRIAAKARFIELVNEHAEELFLLQLDLARNKSNQAIDSMLDRAFGRSQDHIDLTTDGKQLGITPEQAEQLIRARANRSDS